MSQPRHFATPEDAESAFYDALSRGDLDALMAVWSEDEDTVCVHPTGAQMVGLNAIRDSWRGIFGNAKLRMQAMPVARWQGMLLAIHHHVETLFVDDDPAPHGPLYVTHVFSRGAWGWRLVSRHASAAADSPGAEDSGPRTLH